jgi:AcrR family transcriptional regulator
MKRIDAGVDDVKTLKRTRGGRERVLAAAADLFGSRSLAGTSLQMIADRLGMSKPAIYHHFRSRDDIVAALMEPVVAEARAAVEAMQGSPEATRASQTGDFYRAFLVRHRKVVNMVFFDRAAMPGDLPEVIDELVDAVAVSLAGGRTEAARAHGMILVYGMAAFVARTPAIGDDEIARLLAGFDAEGQA